MPETAGKKNSLEWGCEGRGGCGDGTVMQRMDGEEADGWMDGWMDGGREGGREGWRDGGMEGWKDGWRSGYTDGSIYFGRMVFMDTCVHSTYGYIFRHTLRRRDVTSLA